MNKPISDVSFSKAILSGLLTGIIAAVLNVVYTIVYREITGFETAEIIMPLSIFIGFPILLTMGGYAYFLVQRHLPKGLNWFIFFITALLAALVLITFLDTRRNGGALLSGLRGLSLGIEIITCLLAVFLIPFFARHPKIYE
jgi:drug/metabolite transporter (DMT)-like permease